MKHFVIDTNVILAANTSHPDLSSECVEECILRLTNIMKNGIRRYRRRIQDARRVSEKDKSEKRKATRRYLSEMAVSEYRKSKALHPSVAY